MTTCFPFPDTKRKVKLRTFIFRRLKCAFELIMLPFALMLLVIILGFYFLVVCFFMFLSLAYWIYNFIVNNIKKVKRRVKKWRR